MALSVWEYLQDCFANPLIRGAIWTILIVLGVGVLYYKLSRKLVSPESTPKTAKGTRRLLRACLFFVMLIILVTIWSTVLADHPGGTPGKAKILLHKVLWTFGVAAVIYIVVSSIQKRVVSNVTGIEARHKVRLTASWIGISLFVVATGVLWAAGVGDLGIFLGLVGAGVALSLQETLLSIAGWLAFIVRRPYDIGDRIEIDGRVGDVIGVSVFQTTMLEVGNWVQADQSTGRMWIIPNSMLVRFSIFNYGKGFPFVWDELPIVVTFESDWQEAEKLLLQAAEVEADKIEDEVKRQIARMQARYAIRYQHFSPTVYASIAGNGITLTLRYLCPIRERRAMTHRISRNVLNAFLRQPKIDFAYTTTRVYRNNEEGKPDLGGARRRASGVEQGEVN